MIVDTCTCGAEFHAGYSGLHAATDERFAHTEWLAATASCGMFPRRPYFFPVRSS